MNISSNALHADIPRQRWLRIIPPILIACIISYMDRVNIAFAMPGGMDEELGISATMAGLAGGIFFIGYLFLQVPGGKIAVHGSGKKFIGWSLVAWAVISVLTGLVTNQYQLLVLRFLLGVAEGGMLPVVLTMISNWFPDAERGRAVGKITAAEAHELHVDDLIEIFQHGVNMRPGAAGIASADHVDYFHFTLQSTCARRENTV